MSTEGPSNVYAFLGRKREPGDPLPRGPRPPDNDDMEARVAKLESLAEKTGERLAAIDTRLTKIETRSESFATKTDVSDAKSSIIMWVVSAILLAQLLPAILKNLGL